MPEKLSLIPDSAGYGVQLPNEVLRVVLDGGRPRHRKDVIGGSPLVSAQWTLDPDEYDYLMGFYFTTLDNGSLSFLVDLIIDGSQPAEYTANFVPGSFGLAGQQGLTYVVQAQMDVTPNARDAEYDAAIAMLQNEYGDGAEEVLLALAEFANEVLPENLS